MSVIPKVLHYVFLSDPSSPQQKAWSLVHYVCVRSAVERIQPDQVYLHCNHEPSGPWWGVTSPLMTLVKIAGPEEIFGNPVVHPAHQADVIRLEVLVREGGIYLDLDVFVHRNFDDLLQGNSVVMGMEGVDGAHGTANAVLLARPGAPFLQRWYEEYRWFRGRGRTVHWNEHSVELPWKLAQRHPAEITILDEKAFFWPLWTPGQLELIFEPQKEDVDPRSTYANHLWESMAWDRYLNGLTPGRVRAVESPFHRWIRPLVADLPDDYGMPAPVVQRKSLRTMAKSVAVSVLAVAKRPAGSAASRLLGPVFSTKLKTVLRNSRSLGGREAAAALKKAVVGMTPRGRRDAAELAGLITVLETHVAALGRHHAGRLQVVDLDGADTALMQRLMVEATDLSFLYCGSDARHIHALARTAMDNRISFRVLDMVADPLPDGDICLIRGGVGHLTPEERTRLLPKLAKYREIYLTEPIGSAVAAPTAAASHASAGSETPLPLSDRRLFGLHVVECWRSTPMRQDGTITYRIVFVPETEADEPAARESRPGPDATKRNPALGADR